MGYPRYYCVFRNIERMIHRTYSIMLLLIVSCGLCARPLEIIIVTSDAGSETGYSDFLREIYLDNANVEINADRYDESLSDSKKLQLSAADLIIVSSDNAGADYNGDSAFWSSLSVPILCHNTSLARSNTGGNWDWFGSDRTTVSVSKFYAVDPNDMIFNGVDLDAGVLKVFDTAEDMLIPDAPYTGNGTCLATDGAGLPLIVRFDGNEPNYYDGSLYAANHARRIFFAMPDKPEVFFDQAAAPAKQLLRNAITTLLSQCWLTGDIDCDRDVDIEDLCEMASQWLLTTPPQNSSTSADIVPDGSVNTEDFAQLAAFWMEGFDNTAPLPNPFEWTDVPAIADGGAVVMKAKKADDDLHGVQYSFDCIEYPLLSSGWQYDRDYLPVNVPTGVDLSFKVKARDTSSRFNETGYSPVQTVRTDGLFYYSADASAAVALDNNRFIMADDEFNILQVYNWSMPSSGPIQRTDITAEIGIDPAQPESDIEGATWFNNRVFWITSHGRSRFGDYWQSRYRFFATSIAPDGTATVDGVYSSLIDDLIGYDRIWNLGLEAAIGTVGDHIDTAAIPGLAPKVGGLNIEGLCTTADGTKMFIGLRNPRPHTDGEDMALVIPLANPEAVVLNGAAAIFEAPILIDLNGLGIRSIEYSPAFQEYLIIAGSHKSGNDEPLQNLYKYSMSAQDRDKLATFSDNFTPEAMFQFPGSNKINLLSDDGTRMIETPTGQQINKTLPLEQRTFRTRTIKP